MSENREFDKLEYYFDSDMEFKLHKEVAKLRYEKPTKLKEKWVADQTDAIQNLDENNEVKIYKKKFDF